VISRTSNPMQTRIINNDMLTKGWSIDGVIPNGRNHPTRS
jgi:hypothetical protein